MEEARHGNIIKGIESFKIESVLIFTESFQSQETSSGLQRLGAALFLFTAPMPKKIEGLINTTHPAMLCQWTSPLELSA